MLHIHILLVAPLGAGYMAQAEDEVRRAKDEYAALLQNNYDRTTVQQIRSYYDEFLGWANEFDLASIPRKRAFLAQLFEKVEAGRKYKITIHLKGSLYAVSEDVTGNTQRWCKTIYRKHRTLL